MKVTVRDSDKPTCSEKHQLLVRTPTHDRDTTGHTPNTFQLHQQTKESFWNTAKAMPTTFCKEIHHGKALICKMLKCNTYALAPDFLSFYRKHTTCVRMCESSSSLDCSTYLARAEIAEYDISRGCGHTHRLLIQQVLNTNNAATSIVWKKAFSH